jgi:hypothetical protein
MITPASQWRLRDSREENPTQPCTRGCHAAQLADFRVLLDLTAERLWDLQRDFTVLQEEMVKACAMLGTLAAPVELQPCQAAASRRYLGRSALRLSAPPVVWCGIDDPNRVN